jgi:hypothetical protein
MRLHFLTHRSASVTVVLLDILLTRSSFSNPFPQWGQAVLRYFAAFLVCGVSLLTVAGCGGGGGEAEFTPTEAMTEDQENYAEEYEKQQQENARRQREGYN